MKKFSFKEAEELKAAAYKQIAEHPELRFGQSLWNLSYERNPELMNSMRGEKRDFFHCKVSALAYGTFLEYYVE